MRGNEARIALRQRVIDLVLGGDTYETVSCVTGLTRSAVGGIMFRFHNPDIKRHAGPKRPRFVSAPVRAPL